MFKKLKDKLAEEVKSSPQRIQQFAQAAQAAVTSASSSISDITNSDLFSIGDNDNPQSRTNVAKSSQSNQSGFEDISLIQPTTSNQTSMESIEYVSSHDIIDHQRQRRLSNSSFSSDLSFRLPNYESPSMYHLQSDMEVSASEAEDRSLSSGSMNLDRVTKEQLYLVYKRTQERYKKYRSQYADLARHYKLLERENGKARSVLVETQDKALRRISELREQCTLEQSAKAHLEKALRVELEEKGLKIDALTTKIKLLQKDDSKNEVSELEIISQEVENNSDGPLIDLSTDSKKDDSLTSELTILNNKIEKIEQLNNKYKESLKAHKEKNAQMMVELQILSKEIESKNKEIDILKATAIKLTEAREKIKELSDLNEELQNQINSYDFTKTREMSVLEIDLQKAQDEIKELQSKIEIFNKKEEEYAISLAENKLTIHKELESKENLIKSLKDNVSSHSQEIQSMNIVIGEYKNRVSLLEDENSNLKNVNVEFDLIKKKLLQTESLLQDANTKYQSLEQIKSKLDEENKCLQLQLKQETAEKLAMIDRNTYLDSRNAQIIEENDKKSQYISSLENNLIVYKSNENKSVSNVSELENQFSTERNQMLQEISKWKAKYEALESEIQDEREELVKLQSEIENLLRNHEQAQVQNDILNQRLMNIENENSTLKKNCIQNQNIQKEFQKIIQETKAIQEMLSRTVSDVKYFEDTNKDMINTLRENLIDLANNLAHLKGVQAKFNDLKMKYQLSQENLEQTNEAYQISSKKIKDLLERNDDLEQKIVHSMSSNESLEKTINEINSLYASSLEETNRLKHDNSNLITKIKETETLYTDLKHKIQLDNDQQTNDMTSKDEEIDNLKTQYEIAVQELKQLKVANENILMKLEESKKICDNLHAALDNKEEQNEKVKSTLKEKIDDLEKEQTEIILKLNNYQDENIALQSKLNVSEQRCEQLQGEINICREECSSHVQNIAALEKNLRNISQEQTDKFSKLNFEHTATKSKLEQSEKRYRDLEEQLQQNNNQHSAETSLSTKLQHELDLQIKQFSEISEELAALKVQNDDTEAKLRESMNKCQDLKDNMQQQGDQHLLLINKLDVVETDKQILQEKLYSLEDSHTGLNREYELLKEEYESFKEMSLKQKDELAAQINNRSIEKLEANIKSLEEENSFLKSQSADITNNLNILEQEIKEVRESHKEMEHEKDRLHSIVQKLGVGETEQAIKYGNTTEQNNQDEKFMPKISKVSLEQPIQQNLSNECNSSQNGDEDMKEENRRLKSDIEGLQSYLKKISKENSVLNDKLRESMASSETLPDKNENINNDITKFKDEIQSSKNKIDHLERENTFLVEENLELKDQLQSHNYNISKTDNEDDKTSLRIKCKKLQETKDIMEKKVTELESINTSVNGNVLYLQESNEKLKLSNDKLSRRLDEALVSLRHLHSLQENTELEYLRNILFEYLTGSGTHSITLAKVLAAVVKFDDMQTKQVIQKEKERQGLLRQLRLI